ncbi:NUDIX hydrolase domain-like protein, partial [Vararia minispora EC-137]
SSRLYKFHRPRIPLNQTPHPLKRESRTCIKSLLAYHMRRSPPPYPISKTAAVLVALFVGRMGDLYVLLSRRSETLRSYAGDTALPGGKVDPADESIEDTARREAFEEIGLPQNKDKIPLLCVLDPFLAGNNMLVTPVVVLILDNTLRPVLNQPEVALLFSHPLAGFLSITAPSIPSNTDPEHDTEHHELDSAAELAAVELQYHTYTDMAWPFRPGAAPEPSGRATRLHRFLTGRETRGVKPVFGLTAAILIRVAQLGFGREPEFDMYAQGQPDMRTRVAWAVRN